MQDAKCFRSVCLKLAKSTMSHESYQSSFFIHLFHEASLAITVRVLLGVQLVHQASLLVRAGGRGRADTTRAGRVGARGSGILGSVVIGDRGLSGGVSTGAVDVEHARARLPGVGVTVCGTKLVVSSVGTMLVGATTFGAGQVGGTASTLATNVAALQGLGLAVELIPPHTRLAGDMTALPLELLDGDGWHSSSAVVLGLLVMNLMHRRGAVDNMRLDGLLLDHGLDVLVNVVVNVLASGGRSLSLSAGGRANLTSVLGQTKTSMLLGDSAIDPVMVTVTELFVLGVLVDVSVLLGENLSVLDRLDSGVVVLLVDLLVHGPVDLLVLSGLDMLVLNSGLNVLF